MKNIVSYLKDFRLAGIVKTYDLRLSEAGEKNLSHKEFLEIILEDERLNRESNRKKRMYSVAHFPHQKYMEDFDFTFQPSLKKGLVLNLATGAFIPKGENVVFIGQPGTGKTHLSLALGLKALSYGYTCLFTTVWDMITTLQSSRADLT